MANHAALFEELHRQYQPMVLQMCLGFVKGDKEQSQDLAQEVFINVWNSLDRFRGEASHKTWIYRITVNTCLQFLRSEKHKTHVALGTVEQAQVAEIAGTDKEHKELYRAIGKLGEVERLIIMMVLDELGYEEIAEVMGLSPGNLRVKIHRIKQQLKKLLQDG